VIGPWGKLAGMVMERAALPAGGTPPAGETKKSRTGAVIALHLQGQPVWTPRDFARLADEGFARNAIAYRCVRMIAEAAASVPWLLYEGPDELTDHPLLELLERPNPQAAGPDLMESWYSFLMVAGNAYLELVSLEGTPRELYVLRPDRVKAVAGSDGWPEAYIYSANGREVRFANDPVSGTTPILHMRFFHPQNDHYGMSPLEAAAYAIDIHNAAGAWNKSLLDNAARPSGALVYRGEGNSNLSDDQFERLKRELEENYQGAANAGRPLLLEGGLDWKSMGLSPKDMDFIEAKHVAAREIALALGVPPMLLGIPGDNTFSNYQEANRVFWRQTVLPLVGRTARAFTQWLKPHYGGDLRLWYDPDEIPALRAERDSLWKRVGSADFLTDNEKREALGYGPKAEGEG